jgi:hypothetical protein
MGTKILRQRLKGPSVAAYYPRKTATISDVKRAFGPHLTTWDNAEEDRLEYIEEYATLLAEWWTVEVIWLMCYLQTQSTWEERAEEEEWSTRYANEVEDAREARLTRYNTDPKAKKR